MPTTRPLLSISATNETDSISNPISQNIEYLSPELPLPDELIPTVINDNSIQSPNDLTICTIVNDDDDDDLMPVVAFVEEEQSLEELTPSDELNSSFIIVASTDCSDEIIQLDDTIPSCSSGYESSAVLTNIDTNIHEENNETKSTNHPSSTIKQKKTSKRHQRYKYGKSRARSRSSTPRILKKQRLVDDDTSLVTIITFDQIEQHLRTLFMPSNEPRRTRTRPIKTPTRLVEENNTTSMKIIEPDTNVFDIFSSSTTTDTITNDESTQNQHQSCTYNVIISNTPNKLGLTIKKVVPS